MLRGRLVVIGCLSIGVSPVALGVIDGNANGICEIATIFPNLPRFDDPFASSTANLGFL